MESALPLINILIRTSYRPAAYRRCIESIEAQNYPNIRLIVSYDNIEALQYISLGAYVVPVYRQPGEFSYNLYCNDLKERVEDGYFFYLDDDDILLPGVLHQIIPYLIGPGIICQFLRNLWHRPTDMQMRHKVIRKGHVGLPCIILHHSVKDLATFGDSETADYEFIKTMSGKVNLSWVKIPVVSAEVRSKGQMEKNL